MKRKYGLRKITIDVDQFPDRDADVEEFVNAAQA